MSSKQSAEEKAAANRVNQKIQYQLLLEELETYSKHDLMPLQSLRDSGFVSKAAKLGPKYLTDIILAITNRFNELSQFDRGRVQKVIDAERAELIEIGEVAKKEGKKKKAKYEDYVILFNEELGEIKRDIFTGDLHYRDPDSHIWCPVLNVSESLQGRTMDLSIDTHLEYSAAGVDRHLATFKRNLKPELLVAIPEWDGSDRIKEMCSYVHLLDKNVSHAAFEEITKEWLANVFKKLIDPTLETFKADEFILILTGKQGAGKDFWVKALLCGLEQWFSVFQIISNERDVLMQLHENLVLNIREFDRTAKIEVSTLKYVVDADHTKLRASHAKRSEFRFSHASFIATCNVTDIFRDHTGARRYAPFELDFIEWEYDIDKTQSLKILAQANALAKKNFKAPEWAWNEIKQYRNERLPTSPEQEVLTAWLENLEEWLQENPIKADDIRARKWIKNSESRQIFERISKQTGKRDVTLRKILNTEYNLGVRDNGERGFYLKIKTDLE